jgi:hypothetical protein
LQIQLEISGWNIRQAGELIFPIGPVDEKVPIVIDVDVNAKT